jgi:undecaprenyl-diphosphatase
MAFFNQILSTERRILKDKDSKLFLILIVGSIPAAFFGLAFQDFVEKTVRQPLVVGIMLIVFALILKLAESRGKRTKDIQDVSFRDGVVIGAWQALSLIPGVSRSGSTITGGLFEGFNREAAVRFSFLLATPAIVGVGILKVKELVKMGVNGQGEVFIVGFLVSAISGWLVIRFLLNYIRSHNLDLFIWYRIVVGVLIILLSLTKY